MKKLPFLAAWLFLIGCFLALNLNNAKRFDTLTARYDSLQAVNLDTRIDKKVLAKILTNNSYVDSYQEAEFVTDFLVDKLTNDTAPERPEAILELQKEKWQIPAERITEKDTAFQKRLEELRQQTGWTEEIDSLYQTQRVPNSANINEGEAGDMEVFVYDKIPNEKEWTDRVIQKILKKTRIPSKGVIVRLQKYRWNENEAEAVTMAYARTDENGRAVFQGLHADSSYSVLPIRQDVSYGSEKGTYLGTWGEHVDKEKDIYEFTSKPLKVRMFRTQKLVNMRDDGVITVRTPESFRNQTTSYMIYFLVGWVLVFIAGHARGRKMDITLATGLMLASGLSMLLMFGINDPLTEKVLGYEMAQGCIAGIIVIFLLMLVDLKKFYQDRSWIKFDILIGLLGGIKKGLDWLGLWRITRLVKKAWRKNPTRAAIADACSAGMNRIGDIPGIGYLLTALGLSTLLWMFGTEVGGMKVNLDIGFPIQPSEIIKFSFLVFIAVFLFEKGDSIVAYSEPVRTDDKTMPFKNFGRKFMTMGCMLIGMILLMALYMLNSDMGPALVVALTFIVLYSMVKSKIVFDKSSFESEQKQLLHSDIAMLIIGVLTYAGALWAGYAGFGFTGMELFGVLWFLAWVAYGWFNGKRIYETPLMFNLIVYLFVFGANKLEQMEAQSIAERLADRNSMCINTWGTLGGEPGINTQVAEGLWGLASGGFTGQGLGNAQAHYIPAFHTDMILQSIGEILGFFGIAAVIILISILLKRTIVAGYQSGHRFFLYLCSGIAIVTGIQLFIIAFGSLGVIPLTGISVPFFSFGRVSLVLNMMAFGVALSISSRNITATGTQDEKRQAKNRPYNLTVGMLTLAYASLALLLMGIVAHYQVGPERDKTLVREVFVYDTNGAAVVKYNPRIEYLTSKMMAGNVYDRNGVLLATSDPNKIKEKKQEKIYHRLGIDNLDDLTAKVQKRYYPLAEHTFFMVGDANNRYYFPSVDNEPYGYLADARHMSHMRGYDNVKRAEGKPVTGDLTSHKYKRHRFLPSSSQTWHDVQLRDYRALIPFLKEGSHSSLLEKYNAGEEIQVTISDPSGEERDSIVFVKPNNINLTMDAELQVRLQNGIPKALADKENEWTYNKKYRRYERYSIVVLDAINGDLLASANYPLPDYDIIEETIENKVNYYNDNNRPREWKAYTDRDLGLTYYTKPGSSGKVMSSLAGLMHDEKEGKRFNHTYKVYREERIHAGVGANAEPPIEGSQTGVDLETAITKSSNCYFINLVNDLDLYDELAQIYGRAGHRIGTTKDGKLHFALPYKLNPTDEIPVDFISTVTAPAQKATRAYQNYITQREKPGGKKLKMIGEGSMAAEEWMWAWGEGSLDATPAAMARVAATAATGKMPQPRYLTSEAIRRDVIVEDEENLNLLREAMKKEAMYHGIRINDANVGGKTGTPERALTNDSIRNIQARAHKKEQFHKKNDGWYIAFIDHTFTMGEDGKTITKQQVLDTRQKDPKTKVKGTGKIAVAVRVERSMASGSPYAKRMMRDIVLPVLRDLDYIE